MTSKQTKFNKQLGFGILEVVITLFVIGVTLLMFQLTSNAVVLNKYGRYKEVALRIAEDQIQELRTTTYANLPASGSFNNSLLSTIPQGAGTMTLTEQDDGFTSVDVVVSWLNPSGTANQEVRLSTYIWQYGIGK